MSKLKKLLNRISTFSIFILGLICLLLPLKVQALQVKEQDKSQEIKILSTDTVEDNLLAIGQKVKIEGTIKGDLVVIAAQFELKGRVEGNLLGLADKAFLTGEVTKDVYLISRDMVLSQDLLVQKDFFGMALENLTNLGAKIGGKTQISRLQERQVSINTILSRQVLGFLSTIILGWFLLWLVPKLSTQISENTVKHMGKNLLIGFASIILLPLMIFLAGLTIIGLPIAIILGVLLWLAIYTAWIWVSLALGKYLTSGRYNQLFRLFLGLLILRVIALAPGIGPVLAILVVLIGTGGLVSVLLKLRGTL